jgi:phosphate-selective porin OprO/OprP
MLFLSGPGAAQETALVDILSNKGVLSDAEVQRLRSTAGGEGAVIQALINLLQAKGLLAENDLAQLQPAAPASAPALLPHPRPSSVSNLSVPDLNERLTRVEEEVYKKPPFVAGYEEGFFVRSADGHFSLRIGGRASLHGLYQQEDTAQNDSLFMDRVRFSMDGVLYKYFQYKVETDFTSSAGLRDAYLNVNYSPQANVQIGQYKVPFSYEALLSKRYLDLVERSAVTLNAVTPSRDIGLMLHGRLGSGWLTYHLALLNGSGQNRSDNNSAKDVAARLVLAPFVTATDSLLSGFTLGGAMTFGHQPRSKSIAGITPTGFEFFQPVEVRGDRLRIGGHLAWFAGPYSLTSEYIYTAEERQRLGANGEDLSNFVTSGGYVGGTWLLSGEKKVFNRPNRPQALFLNPVGTMEGWGSWELAIRYEFFTLDNDADGNPGALRRNRFDAARLGVNWYLNPWTRVSVEYLYSLFDDARRSPRLGHHSVNSFLSRVQVEF